MGQWIQDPLGLLADASGRFERATQFATPNLHAVIVAAAEDDHPYLYSDSPRPPVPVALRSKIRLRELRVPLHPSAKVYYFGDPGYLSEYLDLSRIALAALRVGVEQVDAVAKQILYGDLPDPDDMLADASLLFLAGIIEQDVDRAYLMERWVWGDTEATKRVPYYPEDRREWMKYNPGVEIPRGAPNVTTFTHDVFTTSSKALAMVAHTVWKAHTLQWGAREVPDRDPDATGSTTMLCQFLGWSGKNHPKLLELDTSHAIRIEDVTPPNSSRPLLKLWVLDAARAYNPRS